MAGEYYCDMLKHVTFVTHEDIAEMQKRATGSTLVYNEPRYPYDAIEAAISPDTEIIIIKGYFQSLKYFANELSGIIDVIYGNLGTSFIDGIKTQYMSLSPDPSSATVCVHVRRSDYLQKSNFHTIIPEDYYKEALSYLPNTTQHRLLIFSDDIDMIQEWDLWKSYQTAFVIEPDALRTLLLMSECDSFILANSSLSLNAFYIAQNRNHGTKAFAPSKWFGPDGPTFNITDLVPFSPNTMVI